MFKPNSPHLDYFLTRFQLSYQHKISLVSLHYHLHIPNCFPSFLISPLLILLLPFFGSLLTQYIASTCTPHRPHRYDPTSTPIDPICCLLRPHMNSKSTSGPSYINPTSNPQTPHRPSHCRLHVDTLILTRRRERRKESDRTSGRVFGDGGCSGHRIRERAAQSSLLLNHLTVNRT